jgi:signal transduction histidine kinase
MLSRYNLILYKTNAEKGPIEDFEILLVYPALPGLQDDKRPPGQATLLNDLPEKANFFATYKALAADGGTITLVTDQEGGIQQKKIRSTLISNKDYLLELWNYIPESGNTRTIENNDNQVITTEEPRRLFIAKPVTGETNLVQDFHIQSLTEKSGTPDHSELDGVFRFVPPVNVQLERLIRVFKTGIPEEFVSIADNKGRAGWQLNRYLKAVNHVLIIVEDIFDKQEYDLKIGQLNRVLLSKNRELEHLNSELRTFSSIAANDYNEILKKMYTSLEYIIVHDGRALSNEGKANLRRVQSGIQKMKLLTEDIVSFSSLEAQTAEKELVNLRDYIERVKAVLSDQVPGEEISIECSGLEPVKGYPAMLYLLFFHLLDNSVKFRNRERSLHIDVKCSRINGLYINHADASPDTYYDRISIADNGIGFEHEYANKLFTIFFRVDKTNKFKGSGTGLAYCRKIMQLHDGFITAESDPGNGAVFNCYFPFANGFPGS